MANKRLSGPQSCAHFSWTANLAARLSRFNRTSRGRFFPPKRIQKPLFPERSQQLFHQDFQIEPWFMKKNMSWFLNINRSPSFSRHIYIISFQHIYIYMQPTPLPTRSQPGWVTSPPPFHGGVDRPMIRPENDRPWEVMLEQWASPSGVESVVRGGSSSVNRLIAWTLGP